MKDKYKLSQFVKMSKRGWSEAIGSQLSQNGFGFSQKSARSSQGYTPYRMQKRLPFKGRRGRRGSYNLGLRRYIERIVEAKTETKMCSTISQEYAQTTISSMALTPVPMPSLGVQTNQRVGNKIIPKGLELRYALHNNSSQEVLGRILILKVHDGTMTGSEIDGQLFEGTSAVDVTEDGWLSDTFRKVNREQFTVIRDIQVHLGAVGLVGAEVSSGKLYVNLQGEVLFHDGTSVEPIGSKYVVCWLFRQHNNDESLGATIEISHQLSFYYKDF